jgi:hypothetical protein
MPRSSDAIRTLSENLGCEVAGLTPQKRRAWLKRGVLLDTDISQGLTELQVIELAVVMELHALLGAGDAEVIWRESREMIRESVFVERLDLVIDAARRESTFAVSDEEVAAAVSTGRLVRVVPLAELIGKTRDAFRRLCPPSSDADADVGGVLRRARRNP